MNNILSSRALKYNIPSLLILLYLLYALIYAFLKEPQHSQTHVFKNAEKMAAVDPSRVDYLRSGFSYKKLVVLDSPFTRQYFGDNGRLDSQIIDREALFDHFKFLGSASFSNTTFKQDVAYNECNFGDSIASIPFYIDVIFSWDEVKFLKNITIIESKVQGNLLFNSCKFNGNLCFTKIAMRDRFEIDLSNSVFNKGITIGWGHYFDLQIFKRSGVDLVSLFKNGIPDNLLDTIGYKVVFSGDSIKGLLDASSCIFLNGGGLIFDRANLPDSIDLSYSQLSGTIDLTTVDNKIIPKQKTAWWAKYAFGNLLLAPIFDRESIDKCNINLINTDVNKLDIEYKYFKLYFSPLATVDQMDGVYQNLLEKFKKEGKMESYEALDIEYHNFQGGIFNWCSKYWWNYGYSKWLIFIWSAVLIIIFTFINYLRFPLVSRAYSISSIDHLYANDFSKVKSEMELPEANYGPGPFMACLLYTFIIFFGIKLDVSKLVFRKRWYALFVMFQFLAGLVSTGFIIHLIIQ